MYVKSIAVQEVMWYGDICMFQLANPRVRSGAFVTPAEYWTEIKCFKACKIFKWTILQLLPSI